MYKSITLLTQKNIQNICHILQLSEIMCTPTILVQVIMYLSTKPLCTLTISVQNHYVHLPVFVPCSSSALVTHILTSTCCSLSAWSSNISRAIRVQVLPTPAL